MVSLRVSRVSLAVASLALTLGVAACSGSEQSSPPAAGGSATASTSSPSSSPAAGGAAGSTFCSLVKDQSNALTSQKASELVAADSPEAWKTFFAETAEKNQALVDAAPAEIKKDVETVNATTKALRAEMERVGYDVKKVDPSKISSLTSPVTLAASKKLGDYARSECGIDLAAGS